MPVKLERKLKKQAMRMARRRGMKGKAGKAFIGRYVYGTMRKTGWRPSREK